MKIQRILSATLLGVCLFFSSCQEEVPPTPQGTKTFMLAIINPPNEVPFDFEADEAIGDYHEDTGLLRIQAVNMFNGKDKIELTIKQVSDGIIGTYPIGNFSQSSTNVKAAFIDGLNKWNTRSTSGSLKITKFEQAESPNAFLLSATFTFRGSSASGEVVVENGEIENAVILE